MFSKKHAINAFFLKSKQVSFEKAFFNEEKNGKLFFILVY